MQMPRPKLDGIAITGMVFLLLTIFFVWLTVKNFWTYSRMRSFHATVVSSSLRIAVQPSGDREYPDVLLYILNLDLVSEDGTNRPVHWQTDAGHAAYPEEALDELAAWAPGTKGHPIQMIRGDSRDLRIEELDSSPELEAGIGGIIASMIFGIVSLAMLAGLSDEHTLFKRFRWRKKLGVWLIFFGVGLMPLSGVVFFTYSHLQKMGTWRGVTANRIEQGHKFQLSDLPAEVVVTPSAKSMLEGATYDLISYEWNGRKVRGAIGRLGGVHDALTPEDAEKRLYKFRINPRNRWELSQTLGWNREFGVPFAALLFFGVAFCGAGLAIRKSEF